MTATAASSAQWLPLVLAPVALLVWIPVIAILFTLGARGRHNPGDPQGGLTSPPRRSRPPTPPPTGRPREERLLKWGMPVDRTSHPEWQARERHLYSAGGVNRGHVIGLVGLVGAIAAAALAVFGFPHLDTTLAAFMGAAAGCLFALPLVWLYERAIWRWAPIAHFKLSKISDLNGEWEGHIEVEKGLAGDGTGRKIPCLVRIRQDWSRIRIDFITEATESWSVMATIDDERLHYEYFVVARPDAGPDSPLPTVNPHDGMVRLKPSPPPGRRQRCDELSGTWFNDPSDLAGQDSLRWGPIFLRRKRR